MVGCPLAAAAVVNCYVDTERLIQPRLANYVLFLAPRDCPGELLSLLLVLLFGLVLGWLLLIKEGVKINGGSEGLEIHGDWLQFMTLRHIQALENTLLGYDVSAAWISWSSAAESALADAVGWHVGLSLLRGWWGDAVLFDFALFGWVRLVFEGLGAVCQILVRERMYLCIVTLQ